MSSIAGAVTIFYFLALLAVGSAFAFDSVRAMFSRERQRPNYVTGAARLEDELLSTVAAPTVRAVEPSGSASAAKAA
jgi:predicted lipid-binding transport protein (Tim44 family)